MSVADIVASGMKIVPCDSVAACRRFLQGDRRAIDKCFMWFRSPQREDHWYRIYNGGEVTDDDRAYVLAVMLRGSR